MTSFIRMPEVSAKFKPLRPELSRRIPVPIKAKSRTNHYALVGTAFDYLLRFELQRRALYAVSRPWIAEYVPDMIYNDTGTGVIIETNFLTNASPADYIPPAEVARRIRSIVESAKESVATYSTSRSPNYTQQFNLGESAIRLAKLDPVYRAGRLDPRFEEVDPQDVQDLLDMLAIVPFDKLLHPQVLFLNPDFGESSHLVSGADTDLISGDLLVDFKATMKGEMQGIDLDQLLGYFLLARKQHVIDPTFPVINQVGLYYCRHGYLWSVDVNTWTDQREFLEIEQWFFKQAEKVLRRRSPRR
ncbi:MAG: hypothetical protein HYR71_00070 [Chloroflexi bacterium]|nr:hypothetical protein [Chloroflexota bacterium]